MQTEPPPPDTNPSDHDDAMAPPPTGSLYLRQQENVYVVRDMETLQQWIQERRVGADDAVSEDGNTWTPVGQLEHNLQPTPAPVLHTKPPSQTPATDSNATFSLPNVPTNAWTDDDTEGVPVGLPALDEPTDPQPTVASSAPDDLDTLFEAPDRTEDSAFLPADDPTEPPVLVMVKTEPNTPDTSPQVDVPLISEDLFFNHDLTIPTEEAVAFADDIELAWKQSERRRKTRLRLILFFVFALPPLLIAGYTLNGVAPPAVPADPPATPAPPATPQRDVPEQAVAEPIEAPEDEGTAAQLLDDDDASEQQAIATKPAEPVVPEANPEPKPAPNVEPKPEPKPAPKPAPKVEPKPKPKPAQTGNASDLRSWIDDGWNMVESSPSQAAEQFNKALAVAPANSEALYGLGYAYLGLNKISEALDPLCKAIRGGDIGIQREIRGILSRKDLSCD